MCVFLRVFVCVCAIFLIKIMFFFFSNSFFSLLLIPAAAVIAIIINNALHTLPKIGHAFKTRVRKGGVLLAWLSLLLDAGNVLILNIVFQTRIQERPNMHSHFFLCVCVCLCVKQKNCF